MRIKNTGEVAAAEVLQLYVGDPKSQVDRPVKELKAFEKVYLEAGEEKSVVFSLDDSSFSYFDPESESWMLEPGDFQIYIGASSDDIRTSATINVQ